jgi:hypothetical protein
LSKFLNLVYTNEILFVKISNLLGQELISRSIQSKDTQIDLSSLQNGTYFIEIFVEDYSKTIKIVKQ